MLDRSETWPPNGAEFRNLCLNRSVDKHGHDTSTNHKSAAYLRFDDPKHPSNDPDSVNYCPGLRKDRALESDSLKSKRKKTGNSAIKGILGDFK